MRTVSYDFETPESRFMVLVNDEEQRALWPADLRVPGGWRPTEMAGTKDECDSYLDRTWTDMRPRSLREPCEREAVSDGPRPAAPGPSGTTGS